MTVPILRQDAALVVCVKPPGLLSEQGGLPELLEQQLGGTVLPVHRLDRDVGGVMVYARTREAAVALSALIAARRMEKEYLAVVEGCPEQESGTLVDLLYHDAARNKSFVVKRERRGVKRAELAYRVLDTQDTEKGTLSLLQIRLHTGRSHQIRVQFASRGLPLVGDARYGSRLRGGIALWAQTLRFPDPGDGTLREYRVPPPEAWPWTAFGLHNK